MMAHPNKEFIYKYNILNDKNKDIVDLGKKMINGEVGIKYYGHNAKDNNPILATKITGRIIFFFKLFIFYPLPKSKNYLLHSSPYEFPFCISNIFKCNLTYLDIIQCNFIIVYFQYSVNKL